MSEKYKKKYRISTTRLQSWDYSANALYFVTICCQNRQCFFGNILDSKMLFSEIGKMAEKYWLEIPQHFPFVILHNHIIMPNHVHGIIEIAKNNANAYDDACVETQNFAFLRPSQSSPPPPPTSLSPSLSSSQTSEWKPNKFGPQSKNLASIVRGFKIGVTKNARQINPMFSWQPRYHDHIIRNYGSYQRISNYISTNPKNWKGDKFHTTK